MSDYNAAFIPKQLKQNLNYILKIKIKPKQNYLNYDNANLKF